MRRAACLVVDFPFKDYDWWHDSARAPPLDVAPRARCGGSYRRSSWGERFASYQRVLTYSEFPEAWLNRRWSIDSTVVYPPCRDGIAPAEKQPIILAVGRLVPDKKADVLVEAFRTLCDRGLRGWRLVLAGGSSANECEGADSYREGLKQRAQGYPIDLRMDVPGPNIEGAVRDGGHLLACQGLPSRCRGPPRAHGALWDRHRGGDDRWLRAGRLRGGRSSWESSTTGPTASSGEAQRNWSIGPGTSPIPGSLAGTIRQGRSTGRRVRQRQLVSGFFNAVSDLLLCGRDR